MSSAVDQYLKLNDQLENTVIDDATESNLMNMLGIAWDALTAEEREEARLRVATASQQKVYRSKLNTDANGMVFIAIPQEALDRLGWKEGDELSVDETEIAWDDFEGKGLVVSKPL